MRNLDMWDTCDSMQCLLLLKTTYPTEPSTAKRLFVGGGFRDIAFFVHGSYFICIFLSVVYLEVCVGAIRAFIKLLSVFSDYVFCDAVWRIASAPAELSSLMELK